MPLPVVEITLAEHLTLEKVRLALDEAERTILVANQADVLVECRAMVGYDLDARGAFVEWNARMRARIAHLAVLTDRPMWRLVVSGMALASRQNMRAFANRPDALAWFDT